MLSVLRFKASGYHFAVFKLFLHMLILLGFKPDSNIIINLMRVTHFELSQNFDLCLFHEEFFFLVYLVVQCVTIKASIIW